MSWNIHSDEPDEKAIYLKTAKFSEPEQVFWFWFPRIPIGKITIVQGDPGEGKTTFSLWLAAQATLPAEKRTIKLGYDKPFNVLYFTAEDGYLDTVLPRFLGAGGDKEYLYFPSESPSSFLNSGIWNSIARFDNPSMVIFDPIQAYLGTNVDMHRANEIRPLMNSLAELTQAVEATTILIGHQNKQQGSKAIYRGLGSIDIAAAARSVLEVSRDPQDKTRRIVKHVKSSLAESAPPQAFAFKADGSIGLCENYREPVKIASLTATEKAVSVLKELLDPYPDGLPSRELEIRCLERGISGHAFRDAKALAWFESYKKGSVWWIKRTDGYLKGGEQECPASDAMQFSTDMLNETIPTS